jgi:hypothetical protein
MKVILALFILIVLGLLGYGIVSVVSFEPKKIAPLVFDEVVDPTLMANTPVTMQDLPLTPEQQKRSEESVEKIAEVVTSLRTLIETAPATIKPTLEILGDSMAVARLPAYLLTITKDSNLKREFQSMKLVLTSQQSAEILKTPNLVCELNAGLTSDVLLGDNTDNKLSCASDDRRVNRDQLFIGGIGNDTISDSFGNRIVNGGAGNDTITLGSGRSIIVLEEGWGQDTLSLDCKGAKVEKDEIKAATPEGFPVPWAAPFANFVVVAPSISQADLVWDGNTLQHKGRKDTLKVNDKCFTLITLN